MQLMEKSIHEMKAITKARKSLQEASQTNGEDDTVIDDHNVGWRRDYDSSFSQPHEHLAWKAPAVFRKGMSDLHA